MWYGQTTILILAGMSAIPVTYYEAAIADGASKPRIFFNITMPLLKPTLLYILVTSLVGGMQIFDIPMVMTTGGPEHATETMVMILYNQAFRYNRFGYGSAIAYGIFVIIAIISFILYGFMREKDEG
jgi:multiple sugar transport system permease protein